MRIWTRYLAVSVYQSSALVLMGFIGLFAFFDLLSELDNLGEGAYRMPHALAYVALGLPGLAYEIFPIVILLGAIFAFAQSSACSEFVSIRAAGWSVKGGVVSMMMVFLPVFVLHLALGEFLVPRSGQLAEQIRSGALGVALAKSFKSGLWVKDKFVDPETSEQGYRFVNAREISPKAELVGIRIFGFDQNLSLVAVIDAKNARYLPARGWDMEEVTRTELGFERELALGGSLVEVSTMNRWLWETQIAPELLGAIAKNPETMTLSVLLAYIRHLKSNGQETREFELAAVNKIVLPLSSFVMLLMALSFGYLPTRSSGVGFKVFVGLPELRVGR